MGEFQQVPKRAVGGGGGGRVKSYLNQKYQLPVHQSIWKPVHLKSFQTSKIVWQYISFQKSLMAEWLEQASQWHEMYRHDQEVISSNPSRGRTWGALYFCPKSYLNQNYGYKGILNFQVVT